MDEGSVRADDKKESKNEPYDIYDHASSSPDSSEDGKNSSRQKKKALGLETILEKTKMLNELENMSNVHVVAVLHR